MRPATPLPCHCEERSDVAISRIYPSLIERAADRRPYIYHMDISFEDQIDR